MFVFFISTAKCKKKVQTFKKLFEIKYNSQKLFLELIGLKILLLVADYMQNIMQ